MATIGLDPNGRRRILFMAEDGTRKTIRLGKATQRQAEGFKVKLEGLIGQAITGSLDDEVSRWLAGLDDRTHEKLAKVKLVQSRARTSTTLGAFLTEYFEMLTVKPGTKTAYDHTRRYLLGFFGEGRMLRSIGPQDADGWRTHLKSKGLSDATVARRVGVARMMFRRALKWKLIAENPFTDVRAGSQKNRKRLFFVTREITDKVLAACTDAEWRAIVVLSRYGGLRCPSEHLNLRWSDIDWAEGRLLVHSPKTEHHAGGESRLVPLFPEVRKALEELWNEIPEGGPDHIITRYRDAKQNLRTKFGRILRQAKVVAWPRLFQNLRSSRQTELEGEYPLSSVVRWIGNSEPVALDHYLQDRDEDFRRAAGMDKEASGAAQNQAHQPLPETPNESRDDVEPAVSDELQVLDTQCAIEMGAGGFEPPKA